MISIEKICDFLEGIIKKNEYKYLAPIKQKGIFIVEKCMKNNFDFYKRLKIMPIEVNSNTKLEFEDNAKILLFDDTCYSGDTFRLALNKLVGKNLIINKAAYLIKEGVNKDVDYYYDIIKDEDWFKDSRPLDLKKLKIDSIPYINIYPTFEITTSKNMYDINIDNIMDGLGFSKDHIDINTNNVKIYDNIIQTKFYCSNNKNSIKYEIIIYVKGSKLYISYISDNEHTLTSSCQQLNPKSIYHDLGCFDCEYLEFISENYIDLITKLSRGLRDIGINIVSRKINFEPLYKRHDDKNIEPIKFVLKVLF